ncbi:hypothetical protein ACRYCC_20475 [Actinomadura scrupuli]|uniref:hypothetical protein n=1 Tax=Actinomadura scrupuli TaxID=559629 RepID=UPI003D96C1CF
MTWILVLLCLIVAGVELYMAFDRKRPSPESARLRELEARWEAAQAAQAATEERLAKAEAAGSAHTGSLSEIYARLDALISQLEDHRLPGIDTRLDAYRGDLEVLVTTLQRVEEGAGRQELRLGSLEDRAEADELHDQVSQVDHLARALETNVSALRDQVRDIVARLDVVERSSAQDGELQHDLAGALESVESVVARVHHRVQDQLDREIVETLGGDPPDSGTVAGGLSADLAPQGDTLLLLYANLLDQHGLKVRLQVDEPEGIRYYLACTPGRGPVELEWDFISVLDTLRDQARPGAPTPELSAVQSLLLAVHELDKGFVQIGPLVVVRTPEALLYGVLSVGESRCFDTDRMIADIPAAAARLQALPASRFGDLTSWPLRVQAA